MCMDCLTRRDFVGLAAAAFVARRDPWVEPLFRRAVSDDGPKRVALTFDACPGGFDARIATALAAANAKATIFLTGTWMRRNPAGLALFLDRPDLFALENHGMRHVAPVLGRASMFGVTLAGTMEAIREEVESGANAIREETDARTSWYRGATGRYSPEAIPEIVRLNHRIAAWTLNADQGASLPAESVAARMRRARDGDVIIGHINQPARSSGAGIARGIVALREAGFAFAHLDELAPALAPGSMARPE